VFESIYVDFNSGPLHSPANFQPEITKSGFACLGSSANYASVLFGIYDIDHGLTSSRRAHLPVIMGYGELKVNIPA